VQAAPADCDKRECSRTNAEYALYVDATSVADVAKGSKEAWLKQEYLKPNCRPDNASNPKKCVVTSLVQSRYFNKTVCSLQTVEELVDGSRVSHNSPCNLRKITPGSMDKTARVFLYE